MGVLVAPCRVLSGLSSELSFELDDVIKHPWPVGNNRGIPQGYLPSRLL